MLTLQTAPWVVNLRQNSPGARYASAVYWSPMQPDYRAALSEAVKGNGHH